ncbi:nucleoside hydrolase [Chitinophaga sp. MM2321]|uniref:nucleoside hydrolase n=1 Tax=Chitinophaga sp. MM2321 TaxID=3137178 RepID=UPI0032D57706
MITFIKFLKKHPVASALSVFFFASSIMSGCAEKTDDKKTSIIFDSDIGPDYDDVGAIAILHVLEDMGETKILATVASNKYEGIAGILDVFNTYFKRPDIPIGVPKGAGVTLPDNQHWTDTLLAKYPHKIQRNDDVPDAVSIYRSVLAKEPDHSVTIVTVGFLTNLANLLNSPGDDISPLTGKELIEKKVKLLVSMAGKFPEGKEFNVFKDAAASVIALENWPTKVIYSGFEIGEKIKTGLPITQNNSIQNSPVKDGFSISIPQSPEDSAGRMSWDETAVLVAVRGYEPYYTLKEGKIKVAEDGSNTWDENGKGQFYLVEKESPQKVQEIINQLMMQQPK